MKTYKFTINGQKYEAAIAEFDTDHARVIVNGVEYDVDIEDDASRQIPRLERGEKALPVAPQFTSSFDSKSGAVKAPLPGVVISIPHQVGDTVKKGEPIIILAAMKMQSEIAAPVSGRITIIHVKEKSLVQEGEILITMESDEIPSESRADKNLKARRATDKAEISRDNFVKAPLPGTVLDILVKVGEQVSEGQPVLILEAMKMESEIHSHASGKVKSINVAKGASVKESDVLMELEA